MKKLLTFFAAALMSISVFAESGTCGNNLTWELTSDSVLIIRGTGDMWSGEDNLGWRQYLSFIQTVVLPDGLTAIAPKAFYNCTNLQSVNVPNSVHAIGHKAFVGCERLTDPVYNATIFAYMPRNFCGAYSIPEGIVSVAAYAFCGIASAACVGLTEITIPGSVKRLGVEALGANGLSKITCYAATPPACDGSTFSWYCEETGVTLVVDKSIPVYVPAESVDAYKAAEGWKDFTNIQAVNSPNSLEDTPDVAPVPGYKAQKLIRHGNVYILTGDRTYTITGQEVR